MKQNKDLQQHLQQIGKLIHARPACTQIDVADGAVSASQDAPSSAASVAVLCVAVPAKPATRGGPSPPPSPPSSPPSSPPPSPPSPFVLRALAPAGASQITDASRGGGCVGGGGGERASRSASHPHCAAIWLSTLVPAPAEFRIRKSKTSRQSLPAPPPHPPSPVQIETLMRGMAFARVYAEGRWANGADRAACLSGWSDVRRRQATEAVRVLAEVC